MQQDQNHRLPDLLVAWYGDDFTGAAAVMEVLTFAGLPTALFLDPPTPGQLARFPGLRGIGIASTARTWSPDRMQADLPPALTSPAPIPAPNSQLPAPASGWVDMRGR
ncbi:Putative sugar-binding N-terminal domain-containing protein [Roseovarius azorensis]|uniref:Putative sugar-binding N-terminal domain-containing protein n=1 Tax=Roseovarius azorensis TaxID=1287727 RepID=A0A1H7X557_9RHOB|nr:four-carbon acid sugar kinase family protein [Roseovarius azorensis]SEM28745.1 Putative sugar-binding N-terminal domain-containing protein [Roseovarius azorensis]